MTIARQEVAQAALRQHLGQGRALAAMGWLRHGVTSRVRDIHPGEGNVGYGLPRDKDKAWQMRVEWSRAVGIEPERLVGIHQVHGGKVIVATAFHAGSGSAPGSLLAGEADALITNEPNLPLMTLHADCQPLLLADPIRRIVGVAHAGWRGVVSDVAGETVRAMGTKFGSNPADVVAFLGPAIGVKCYEVGTEVVEAWRQIYPGSNGTQAVHDAAVKSHFDLTRANRLLFERAGVPAQNIEESGICTQCQGDHWFSHRGQGPVTGRFGAMIGITGAVEE